MKEGLYCFSVFVWQLRLPPAAKQEMDRLPAMRQRLPDESGNGWVGICRLSI